MELFAPLLIIGLFLLYMLPAIVASRRGRAPGAIMVLNILLGWTLLGWVLALVWACTELTPSERAAKSTATSSGFDQIAETPPPAASATAPVKIAEDLGWWYTIDYLNKDGGELVRNVRIEKLFGPTVNGEITAFVGFDSAAQAERTFHPGRVQRFAIAFDEKDSPDLTESTPFAATLRQRLQRAIALRHPEFAPEA